MTSIAIIGAGGVGISTCSAILHQHLVRQITLYDSNFEKAEGEALDFAHVNTLFSGTEVLARRLENMVQCDIAILTAGVKSKPGETRLDLLERNLISADALASQMEKVGKPKFLLIVTNPVDVITEYFLRRWASTDTIVFGTGTSLDTLRLRHELSAYFEVSPLNVHAWVVGEHGDSSVSLLSSARIGGHSLDEYSACCGKSLVDFEKVQKTVRQAAYQVIKRKGATCHAIGETSARLVKALLRDERLILPVSVGITERVSASLPCVLSRLGPERHLMPIMSPDEEKLFKRSVSVLDEACVKIPLPPVRKK